MSRSRTLLTLLLQQGWIKGGPPIANASFTSALRTFVDLSEDDVLSTVAFMHRCLRLDPAERPSADELLKDPWFNNAA